MSRHKYTKELLEVAVANSYSFADVARYLGLAPFGGSQNHLRKRVVKFGVDYSHFKRKIWNKGLINENLRKKPKEILVLLPEGSNRQKAYLLRRALIESGTEEKCVVCNQDNIWNDNKLVLEVDHIDGNYLNNLIDNLRFICPNCHSQTINYKNRNRDRETGRDEERLLQPILKIGNPERDLRVQLPPLPPHKCMDCGKKIKRKATRCRSCADIKRKTKIDWPPSEQLAIMLQEKSYTALGRELGVSDNAIRKRLKNYN